MACARVMVLVLLVACSSRETGFARIDGGGADGATRTDATGMDARGAVDGASPDLWNTEMAVATLCNNAVAAYCEAAALCACATPCDATAGEVERARCERDVRSADSLGLSGWYAPRVREILDSYRQYLAACVYMPDALYDQLARAATVLAADIGESCDPWPSACAGGDGVCDRGTCRELPDVGDACELLCRYPARCSGGSCVVPGGDGTSCADDAACVAPNTCIAGTCHAPATAGATCARTSDCAPSHHCTAGTCTPAVTCDGADACGHGTTCGASGSCATVASLGEPCTADDGCARGLVCNSGACAAAPSLGEPCAGSRRCAIDAWCDGGTCAPLRAAGETCTAGGGGREDCASGFCNGLGVCAPLPAEGEICERITDCTSDSYCDVSASTRVCVRRLAAGARCDLDAMCELGLECAGSAFTELTGRACGAAVGCDVGDRVVTHFCRIEGRRCSCAL